MKTKIILIAITAALLSHVCAGDTTMRQAIDAGRADIIREAAPLATGAPPVAEGGRSITMESQYAAVGTQGEKVHCYIRYGVEWFKTQEIMPPVVHPDSTLLRYGYQVQLSADGQHLFVAAFLDFNDGGELYPIVYRYQRQPNAAFAETFDFITSFVRGHEFGIAMDADGDRLVVGNPGSGGGQLWIFLYDSDSNRWTREAVLNNPFVNPNDMGVSVAIDSDRIAVGARQIPQFNNPSEVYIAERVNGAWEMQITRIEAEFNGPQVDFGVSVALRGRTLFAGAPGKGSTGAVYRKHLEGKVEGIYIVYDRETILPPTTAPGQPTPADFGASVAVVDDILVVGSPTATNGDTDGFYHILSENTATQNWTHVKHFNAPGGRLGSVVVADACGILAGRPGRGSAHWATLAPAENFRKQLYDGAAAPFAYKTRVFEDEGVAGGGVASGTYRKNRSIGSLFDPSDLAEIATIETALKQEMVSLSGQLPTLHPGALWDLLLELNYDRTTGSLLVAKDLTGGLDELRLETGAPGTYVLDAEVAGYEDTLAAMRVALSGYVDLLEDDLGYGNSWPSAGHSILNSRVPLRALEVPTVEGEPVADVAGNLMNGYKDYALILQALRDHAYTAVELGKLYQLQNSATAETAMQALISDTLRFTFQNRALFAEIWSEADREALGLDEYDADLDAVLTDLTALHQGDVGAANPLGFEDDFLMLTRAEGQVFDSFNRFRDIVGGPDACLVFDSNQISGRLGAAISEQDAALGLFDNYQENQSTLSAQFNAMTNASGSAILPRLTEIVGVAYPIDSPSDLDDPNHPYFFPESNQGGEISQQRTSINIAINRIERNRVEIDNLKQRVNIEIDRRAEEAGINADISDIYVSYGNEQARLTEEIGAIEAAQEASDQMAKAVALAALGPVGLAVGVATSLNAGVQVGGELGKGFLAAEKERLAGQEKADVREAEDDILQANHEALIATILLEMNTLVLDSQQAALLLRQEVGRLVGLHAERADLERRLAGAQQDLAASFFANPVHRLRATNATLKAHNRFDDAQRWMFFALRSLEYKWNQTFEHDGLTEDDLFRARNARELGEIFYAMCTFDDVRSTSRITQGDWFSIKENYFGYVFGGTYLVTDPVTGEQFGPLSPEDAFRKQLEFHTVGDEIELDFSTVREAGLTFFKNDRYLDKIDFVKVRIPGQHTGINPNQPETQIASIDLFYGGISFIRTNRPGTVNPARADRLENEFTTFNTRHWFFDQGTWQSQEGLLHTSGQAFKDTDPVRPFSADCTAILPIVLPIETFKERSIATTGWRINVGIGGSDGVNLDEVDDIELYFCHKNLQRLQN